MIQILLGIVFFLCLIGLVFCGLVWTYTGRKPQSTDELLKRADKAIKDTSARIAEESRDNIKRIWRGV